MEHQAQGQVEKVEENVRSEEEPMETAAPHSASPPPEQLLETADLQQQQVDGAQVEQHDAAGNPVDSQQLDTILTVIRAAVVDIITPPPDHTQHAEQIFAFANPILIHVLDELKKEVPVEQLEQSGLTQVERDLTCSKLNRIPVKSLAIKAQKFFIDKITSLLQAKAATRKAIQVVTEVSPCSISSLKRQLDDAERNLCGFEKVLQSSRDETTAAKLALRDSEAQREHLMSTNQELNDKLAASVTAPGSSKELEAEKSKSAELQNQLERQRRLTKVAQDLLATPHKRESPPSSSSTSPPDPKQTKMEDPLSTFTRHFVTFTAPDDLWFSQMSIDKVVVEIGHLANLFGTIWTGLQAAYPRQMSVLCPQRLYSSQDLTTILDAFMTVVSDLMVARTTPELVEHLRCKQNQVPEKVNNHKVKSFQQLPGLCPVHPMWKLFWWNEKSQIHHHVVLALLSIYQPLLYRQVLLIEACNSRKLRSDLEFIFGAAEQNPWTSALRLIIIICADQSKVFTSYAHNKNYRIGHAFSKRHFHDEFLPAKDDTYNEMLLSELYEFRPLAFDKIDLFKLFANQTDFELFKSVYLRDRERVKAKIQASRIANNQQVDMSHKFSSLF